MQYAFVRVTDPNVSATIYKHIVTYYLRTYRQNFRNSCKSIGVVMAFPSQERVSFVRIIIHVSIYRNGPMDQRTFDRHTLQRGR